MALQPDRDFLLEMSALESHYLRSDDPVVRSGYHGGRSRWIAERMPLVDAIDRDGDFLDAGCANGLLAADVVAWAGERGHRVVPHGVDLGPKLVALARKGHPEHAENFVVADAWSWRPSRRWTFVYSLLDLSPEELRCVWVRRLLDWVASGGRLVMGSYGSRSRRQVPLRVDDVLRRCGLEIAGSSAGGTGPWSRFAWVAKP